MNEKIKLKINLKKKNKKLGQKKQLNYKIEYFKISTILKNKQNIHKESKDSNFYLKYFFNYKKKNKNLNLLILFNILKKLKKLFSFLIYASQNFSIIKYMSYIKPGFFTNKNYNKNNFFLFPNIIIYLNTEFKNNFELSNNKKEVKNLNKLKLLQVKKKLIKPLLEFYNFNELSKLKIFTIIFNLNYNFYQLLNKFDMFLPINLKNTDEIFFKKIFFTCLKFSKISKILYLIYKQFFYNKKYFKLNNKYTHYWTRTNTFKIKNRF